jgi:hypothetical protein
MNEEMRKQFRELERTITEEQLNENNNNNNNNNSKNTEDTKLSDDLLNMTSTLTKIQQFSKEKLIQLDAHVDYYSRKIINAIQELWKSTQSSETYLKEALEITNKTRSFIRQEFRRLQV